MRQSSEFINRGPRMADKATTPHSNIHSVLQEDRKFECPEHFRQQAHIKSLEDYDRIYRESVEQPEKFWGRIAEELHWSKKWDKVLEWNHPWAKWFVGGQLNLSYNCLDRHVQTARKNKAAIIWESEPGEVRTLTYQQLHREVQKFANVLKSLGVHKGDRVAIYMGMTPEHPIYILYTSGTTGKPKGVVHTTGGYSVATYITTKWVFDLHEEDTYWCTADIGWVTGHSYIVYGPLLNGATSLMYEGAPNFPEPDRFWSIIDRHKVNVFYTAPTAIRTFIKWGDEWPKKHKLDSLRLLGTVGEPINPEAWMWYREVIGHDRCPIVDTWWQTETGHIMISPIPGAIAAKPGSATRPIPGVVPAIVNMQGEPVPDGSGGFLVIKQPWPGMLRTIYGDPDRYVKQYWSQIPGVYFTGDGARKDKDGYFWVMGRVDDVINVSGHRLSTMEVESALVAHDAVAEAAVVGRPDELKGQAIAAFVTLEQGRKPTPELKEELRKWVVKEIGALAKPEDIRFTDTLPKTRSGKIMRRLLRELATSGDVQGDTTTLEDFSVIAKLKESEEA